MGDMVEGAGHIQQEKARHVSRIPRLVNLFDQPMKRVLCGRPFPSS